MVRWISSKVLPKVKDSILGIYKKLYINYILVFVVILHYCVLGKFLNEITRKKILTTKLILIISDKSLLR